MCWTNQFPVIAHQDKYCSWILKRAGKKMLSTSTIHTLTRQGSTGIITFHTLQHKLFGFQTQKGVPPHGVSFTIWILLSCIGMEEGKWIAGQVCQAFTLLQKTAGTKPSHLQQLLPEALRLVQLWFNKGGQATEEHTGVWAPFQGTSWYTLGQYKWRRDKRRPDSEVSLIMA